MSRRGNRIPTDRRTFHDLTPLVSARLAVFPGDVAYQRDVSMDMARKGDPFGLSSIHTTVHLGAHVDAPVHYHPEGRGIDTRSLDYYYGRCQVVTARARRGERIGLGDFDLESVEAPRVLFRTGTFPEPERWNGDFAAFAPDTVEALADRGVILLGIDTPSVDPADDKALECHQVVYRRDLAVLEGIVLDGVEDGFYMLSALPLRLEGADASPVRAVLIEGETG